MSRPVTAPDCAPDRSQLENPEQWSGINAPERPMKAGAIAVSSPRNSFKKTLLKGTGSSGARIMSFTPMRELLSAYRPRVSRTSPLPPMRKLVPEYRLLKYASLEARISRIASVNRLLAYDYYDLRVDLLSKSLLLDPDFYSEYEGFVSARLSARRKIDQILSQYDDVEQVYTQLRSEFSKISQNLTEIRSIIDDLANDTTLPTRRRRFYAEEGFRLTLTHVKYSKITHQYRGTLYTRMRLNGTFADAWRVSALLYTTYDHGSRPPSPFEVMDSYYKLYQTGDKIEDYAEAFSINGMSVLRNFYLPIMSEAQNVRSPESNMQLQQLDTMALFDLVANTALTIEKEINYLLHTLDRRSGLWSKLDPDTISLHRSRFKDAARSFKGHRAMWAKEQKALAVINWIRIQAEHKLHVMGGGGLNEKNRPFTVSNPLSKYTMRFNQWLKIMNSEWCQQLVLKCAEQVQIGNINVIRWQKLGHEWKIKSLKRHNPIELNLNSLRARRAQSKQLGASNLRLGQGAAFQSTARRSYSSGMNACSVAQHVEKDGEDNSQAQLPGSPRTDTIPETTSSTFSKQTQPTNVDDTVRTPKAQADSPADSATPKFWSHRMHKGPDGKDIVVHYCKTLQSTEDVAKHFLDDEIVGFDMEWKAQASSSDSLQNNISLIQIANEKRIALFHIALFKPATELDHFVAPTLRQIMESPNITKVGVSIKADCTRLRKYLGINARGIFELSHLHKLVRYCQTTPKLINKRLVNLSDQVEHHFGLPMRKGDDVRCGDWARPLKYDQIQYAASDPFACVCLFKTMDHKRKTIVPTPPRPAHAELDLPIRLVEEEVVVDEETQVVTVSDAVVDPAVTEKTS